MATTLFTRRKLMIHVAPHIGDHGKVRARRLIQSVDVKESRSVCFAQAKTMDLPIGLNFNAADSGYAILHDGLAGSPTKIPPECMKYPHYA